MANLLTTEKMALEKIFEMRGGYVLNFTNNTFRIFIKENAGIDVYHYKYEYQGGSKANRLRAFWELEANRTVGILIIRLLEYWKKRRELDNQIITLNEDALFNECSKIAERLIDNITPESILHGNIDSQKKKNPNTENEKCLDRLLLELDGLAKNSDHQKRGYVLETLFNELFSISKIGVKDSFRRNDGGEQIDGAFFYNGWFYLVECKWTTKLSNVRDLDSLSGKINRSGKQTMGLFLSIEGWSEFVLPELKQNPIKCIILMDGYDLRCVLSGAISLEKILNAKLEGLNLRAEPFISARELLS